MTPGEIEDRAALFRISLDTLRSLRDHTLPRLNAVLDSIEMLARHEESRRAEMHRARLAASSPPAPDGLPARWPAPRMCVVVDCTALQTIGWYCAAHAPAAEVEVPPASEVKP